MRLLLGKFLLSFFFFSHYLSVLLEISKWPAELLSSLWSANTMSTQFVADNVKRKPKIYINCFNVIDIISLFKLNLSEVWNVYIRNSYFVSFSMKMYNFSFLYMFAIYYSYVPNAVILYFYSVFRLRDLIIFLFLFYKLCFRYFYTYYFYMNCILFRHQSPCRYNVYTSTYESQIELFSILHLRMVNASFRQSCTNWSTCSLCAFKIKIDVVYCNFVFK